MRSPRPTPALLASLVAALLAVTACASDDDTDADVTTGQDPDPTPVATASTTPTTPDTGTDTDTDTEPGATTAATTATSAPGTDVDGAAPLAEPSIELFEVGQFDQPVDVATIPGDSRLFVVEQPGRVLAVSDLSLDVVLDITDLTDADGERGLLGLAFHPTDDLAYVDYTDLDGDTVVAEFAVDPTTGEFDASSRREVLTIDQPYPNHNGGALAFAPDGFLYVAVGDGGSRNDPDRVALDLSTRLGKLLRIDPRADGDAPFTVPADNPFVDDPAADPTIWAFGLRNPWRFSVDFETGDLWIADVGQGDIEEIDHAPATDRADAGRGLNFGWSAFEGTQRFNDDQPADGVTPPVYEYGHDGGRCSVTGGVVVRGSSVPDLDGWYLFGDYCSGEIWALDPASTLEAPRVVDLAQVVGVAAIAAGPAGETYVVSNAGAVLRVVAG